MASIRLKKGNAIIFQLLRKNLAGQDDVARSWKEIKVVTLAVQPSYIDYNYRGRSQINQTQERKGFIDKYGMLFTQVNMGGSFGSKPRLIGLSLKDGYTRLIEFRDEIVRKSNRVDDELDQQEGQSSIFANTVNINAKYVYAINFYDFINDEMFAIDISSFNIRLDAGFNTVLPTYKLGFQEIGDTIKVETKDGVLRALLLISQTINRIQNELDFASNWVANQQIFQLAEFGIELPGQISTQLGNLNEVLGSYLVAMSGKTNAVAAQNGMIKKVIEFSSIKG
jgi:hypothetical protein